MFQFHLGPAFTAANNVDQGKAFLKMMIEAVEEESLWGAILRSESQRFNTRDDRVTYHDEFGPSYAPLYFCDFARDAKAEGLQFVSETLTKDALHTSVSTKILRSAEKLAGGDRIRFEQYLDLFSFNGFRGSLLTKSDIPADYQNPAKNLIDLSLASPLTKIQTQNDGSVEYRNRRGPGTITTNDPGLIAVLKRLEEKWPQSVKYELLLELAFKQTSGSTDTLAKGILELAGNSLVDLRSQPLLIPDTVSTTPTASPLVRLQATQGKLVTTLLHSHVEMAEIPVRRVLQLLDGTRDIPTLARSFMGDYPASSRTAIEVQLKAMLESFFRLGLLIA